MSGLVLGQVVVVSLAPMTTMSQGALSSLGPGDSRIKRGVDSCQPKWDTSIELAHPAECSSKLAQAAQVMSANMSGPPAEVTRSISNHGRMFLMYTVPLEAFLQMTEVQAHEQLKGQGVLRVFKESMGKAIFVSHQWLGSEHPDPHCEQLQVLQKALKNALSGASLVSLPPAIELLLGRLKCPTPAEFRHQPLYIWYDYFCCPQGTCTEAVEKRNQAIASIPEFVSRSYFFLILCPAVPHAEGHMLSWSTWNARGWCRLERMVRELAREDGYVITVTSPNHLNLGWNMHGVGKAPGLGSFSFEDDKAKVGQVLLSLIRAKLQFLLKDKDLGQGENLKRRCYQIFYSGRTKKGATDFAHGDVADAFEKTQSHMRITYVCDGPLKTELPTGSAMDCGWNQASRAMLVCPPGCDECRHVPLTHFSDALQDLENEDCLAAMAEKGDAFLVKALLKSKADPNDRLSKSKKKVNLPKNMPVVCMAAAYHSNDVLEVLLSHKASVNARCGHGGTALAWAAASDNAAAVGILSEAFADPHIKVWPSTSPFRLACGYGSVRAIQKMLIHYPVRLRFCLHTSLVFFGDVDTAGADLSCRNDRGKTAADLLSEMHVPLSLSSAVLKPQDGDADDSFSI
eukprot:s805_g24.t1